VHIKHLRAKQKTKHVSSWSHPEPPKIKEVDLLDWAHLRHHGNLASLYWIHTHKKKKQLLTQ